MLGTTGLSRRLEMVPGFLVAFLQYSFIYCIALFLGIHKKITQRAQHVIPKKKSDSHKGTAYIAHRASPDLSRWFLGKLTFILGNELRAVVASWLGHRDVIGIWTWVRLAASGDAFVFFIW